LRLKLRKRFASAGLLVVLILLSPGCGIELAVIGAAASAAAQGSAAYKQGKLIAAWMGPFDLVVASGEVALGDLGYAILQSNGNASKGEWKIVGVDEESEKVTITVNRKTKQFTEFQIDVTWFGKEPTARLILKRMAVAIDLNAEQDGTGDVPAVPAIIMAPTPEESEIAPPTALETAPAEMIP